MLVGILALGPLAGSSPAAAEAWFPRSGAVQTDVHPSALPMLELRATRIQPVARVHDEQVPPEPEPRAPALRVSYPEEVVLSALRAGDPALARCWQRAQRVEWPQLTRKARLELEIDEAGSVRSVTTDLEGQALPACVATVSRHLPLPATGRSERERLLLLF